MLNIKIPSKLIFEQMATGQMISMRIYNSRLKKFQTTFVIKDFAKNIEHILNTNTADARCYLDVFGNAASLIYLIGFGENNKFLYNYWFNYYSKSINRHELEDLSYQDTVEYLFVDHKNNMIKVVEIENILLNAVPLYINVAKEINNWTPSEFEELQTNIMKDFKTYRGLWNYITGHMSA